MRIVKFIFAGTLRVIAVLALAGPLVALGGVAIGPGTAQAQGVIRDIKVSGNRRVEADTVRSYLSISPGETYSAAKGDAAIKALFATGLFQDVSVDQQGSTLYVQVVENPVVNQVAFEGTRKSIRRRLLLKFK